MGVTNLINKFNVYDYLIAFLLVLFAFNSITQNFWPNSLYQIIITVGLAVCLDLGLSYLKSKLRKPKELQVSMAAPSKLHIPKSPIISGLIIGLLIEPVAFSWSAISLVILAPILAILLKHIIRIKGDHIFNPANIGLLVALVLTSNTLSWWGASPSWLVALFGLFIAYRLKRPNPAIAFLAVYFILTLGLDASAGILTADNTLQQLNNGTILFFGFVMIQEPVTAPRGKKGRLLFGILAAIFVFALAFYYRQYSLLLGLVLADLLVYPINWKLK